MERREAAEFLGVSLSTLDRLASQGRLTRGRARRKTRPVTVYDEGELTRLKASLDEAGRSRRAAEPEPLRPKDAVGFRLDPYYVSLLSVRGAEAELSPGEYARRLVVQGLEDNRVEAFKDEVRALREGLADAFHAFLTLKCGATPDEATEFVNDTILRGAERA